MRDKYCHLSDLNFHRELEKGMVVLMDCDGNKLGELPGDWTDEQCKAAMHFANGLYVEAYRAGVVDTEDNIRRVARLITGQGE